MSVDLVIIFALYISINEYLISSDAYRFFINTISFAKNVTISQLVTVVLSSVYIQVS